MTTIPTVKIEAPDVEGGHIVINESDFDPKIHTLYEEEGKEASELTAAQIKAELTEKGISFTARASKAELKALLDAAE